RQRAVPSRRREDRRNRRASVRGASSGARADARRRRLSATPAPGRRANSRAEPGVRDEWRRALGAAEHGRSARRSVSRRRRRVVDPVHGPRAAVHDRRVQRRDQLLRHPRRRTEDRVPDAGDHDGRERPGVSRRDARVAGADPGLGAARDPGQLVSRGGEPRGPLRRGHAGVHRAAWRGRRSLSLSSKNCCADVFSRTGGARMPCVTRRNFVTGGAAVFAAFGSARRVLAQTAPTTAGPAAPALIEDLVAANRILADQGVLDGYGHVSVRHDRDPNRYLRSRSLGPALVTAADIMEWDLDSVPVDPRGRTGFIERFIHGEIYKARPDVLAVVHNHSPSVVPFGVTTAPLLPLYHMSAFLGGGVPVFDIKKAAGESTDMLVKSPALGRALAQTLGARPVALMRGH